MSGAHDVLTAVDREIISEIWTSTAVYDNLAALCEVADHRFMGSPGAVRARDFLLELMRQYGLQQVHAEEFEHDAWERKSAHLEVLGPGRAVLPCLALAGSPSGEVEGELLNLGHGTPGDFAALGDRIAGRIVMVTNKSPAYIRRHMHRVEKYMRAVHAGAVAFIWARDEGGQLPEAGSLGWGETPPVPGITVSREVAGAMVRAGKGEAPRIRIHTENSITRKPGWNLMGELPGRASPERFIVVGAHYDTHDIAPGAMDNGAGTLVMLEAARVLARYPEAVGTGFRFVCFAGEELGLIGSQRYVAAHLDELDHIALMFNLDGTGRDPESGVAVQGWSELVVPLRDMIKEMRDPVPVDNYVGLYSDMYPFVSSGVPSATLFPMGQTPVRGWSHTMADTMDKVSVRNLRRDAILAARLLLRISNAPAWPARRKSPVEVAALFEEAGLRRILEIEGRWPDEAREGASE